MNNLYGQAAIAISMIAMLGSVHAQHVYKCERAGAPPTFQSEPCATGAQKVVVKDPARAAQDEHDRLVAEQKQQMAQHEAERKKALPVKPAYVVSSRPSYEEMKAEKRARCGARTDFYSAIGDRDDDVKNCSMIGGPDRVNSTVTARGIREQWIYGRSMFLYFDNGILTAIQN